MKANKIIMRFSVALPICCLLLLWSCEEEFIPEVSTEASQIVVEGYIETGDRPRPAFVILTRSFPFFSEFSQDQLNNSFVNGAEVWVRSGEQEVQLSELCLNDLTPEQIELAQSFLDLPLEDIGLNFCAYIDLNLSMEPKEGERYDLEVNVEGETLRATTTIPFHVPIDSLWFVNPPGAPNDTLAQLRGFLSDPPGIANFYQAYTQVGEEGYQKPFASVVDDRLFDGQAFQFPIQKAESTIDAEEVDPATFGLFRRGDAISVRWLCIDKAHFDFWNTLEFNLANQGPFSSYTLVDSNIEGGLGVWGGISSTHYDLVVPEEPE